jgi:hypothetical protein
VSDLLIASLLIVPQAAGSKLTVGNGRQTAARVAADWLCLAAAPTFAIMAVLTALGGSEPDILCKAMPHALQFGGMIQMYVLMSVFHLAPWLRKPKIKAANTFRNANEGDDVVGKLLDCR